MTNLRNKMLIKDRHEKLKQQYLIVNHYSFKNMEELTEIEFKQIEESTFRPGVKLLYDKKKILSEEIRNAIIELLSHSNEELKMNYSEYICNKLHYDYNYLSNIFSEVKGITIQQFIIIYKIEMAKKMLLYDGLSIKETSYRLHYSSPGHLSNQFKKVTGLSPYFFKQLKKKYNNKM
jgi:AraC-like DNA-binding protein